MKKFNKKTKTAVVLGSVLLSSLISMPALADDRKDEKNRPFEKEMRIKWEDNDHKNSDDHDDNDDKYEKKYKDIKINDEAFQKVRTALDSKNYTAFKESMISLNIKDEITEAQFNLIVESYTKAKAGDIVGAQKILKDNNLSPVLHRFVMSQHLLLTDAQKNAIKQAEDLIKQGKTEEAKKLLESAGFPNGIPSQVKKDLNKDREIAMKTAFDTAKTLRDQGKTEEAKKVLTDAGVSPKAVVKIEKEFQKQEEKEKKSLMQMFKKFFKFGKRD